LDALDKARRHIRTILSQFPETLWMSQRTRGAIIGRLEDTIRETAALIHLPVGSGRDIRLHLASELFGRRINTFNQLSTAEIWAVDQWVLRQKAEGLRDWLAANYGEQLKLPEEKQSDTATRV